MKTFNKCKVCDEWFVKINQHMTRKHSEVWRAEHPDWMTPKHLR